MSRPVPHATLRAGRATLRFFLGDCLEVLPQFPERGVDAVVTSPPYNLGIRYRSYHDALPRAGYLDWTDAWIGAVARTLTPDGSLFLNVGAKPSDPWTAMDVAQTARRRLALQNVIHWIKSIAIDRSAAGARVGLDRDLAVGHYKPINSDRFLNDCTSSSFISRRAAGRVSTGAPSACGIRTRRTSRAGVRPKGGLRCRGNTWFIPYETIQSRDKDRPHPATFPPRVPEYCLFLHGLKRLGLVLDPFLGLGSTAIACASLGLDFAGIELDRHYLQEAVSRTRRAINA